MTDNITAYGHYNINVFRDSENHSNVASLSLTADSDRGNNFYMGSGNDSNASIFGSDTEATLSKIYSNEYSNNNSLSVNLYAESNNTNQKSGNLSINETLENNRLHMAQVGVTGIQEDSGSPDGVFLETSLSNTMTGEKITEAELGLTACDVYLDVFNEENSAAFVVSAGSTACDSDDIIAAGISAVMNDDPFMATEPEHVVTKAYVDQLEQQDQSDLRSYLRALSDVTGARINKIVKVTDTGDSESGNKIYEIELEYYNGSTVPVSSIGNNYTIGYTNTDDGYVPNRDLYIQDNKFRVVARSSEMPAVNTWARIDKLVALP